jgi:WD40 repeat protein
MLAAPVISMQTRWRIPPLTLALSQDGALLATGDSQGHAGRLWGVLETPSSAIHAMAFDHGSYTLATASVDGTLCLWDLPFGRQSTVCRVVPGSVSALAFAPDNSLLAMAVDDGTILLWSTQDQQIRTSLRSGLGLIETLAFAQGGGAIFIGVADGTVCVWKFGPTREPRMHPELRRLVSPQAACLDNLLSAARGYPRMAFSNLALPQRSRRVLQEDGLPVSVPPMHPDNNRTEIRLGAERPCPR